jgi:mannose-6-phosphate isomerase-like protein (cupin superfamily)
MNDKINLDDKLGLFDATWTPKIIGELNGQQVKLAKLQGELTWHSHAHEDELFLILEGSLLMQIKNESGETEDVHLNRGDMYIVPKGVEHNPIAKDGASVMLFEPASTKHTGELIIDRTVTDQEWI